jgi:hypothetical protein
MKRGRDEEREEVSPRGSYGPVITGVQVLGHSRSRVGVATASKLFS